MEIELKLEITDGDKLKSIEENLQKPYSERKETESIKIGSLCSDCANPTEKVMQSYIFDIENIIDLGMYEKAGIATEVLMERYDDPLETALNKIFPVVDKVIEDFHKKLKTKVELIKSLQAADTAMKVLEVYKDERWEKTRCVGWNDYLKETVKDCCELLLP